MSLVKFYYVTKYQSKEFYLNSEGVEKIEQEGGTVKVFYQNHCAWVTGELDDVAVLLGYKEE